MTHLFNVKILSFYKKLASSGNGYSLGTVLSKAAGNQMDIRNFTETIYSRPPRKRTEEW